MLCKLCEESASVADSTCDDRKQNLSSITEQYEPKNIFNADKTGLFFECTPDSTFTLKGDDCHGGKRSKERITVLSIMNATGTEKLTPLVIGKSANPRYFKEIKSKPVDTHADKKAWMKAHLFSEWLVNLKRKMKNKQRQILLLKDNCTPHSPVPNLSHLKVQCFPPNATSKLPPLNLDIIEKFKHFYRCEVVHKMICDLNNHEKILPINLLDAVRIIDKSWRCVSAKTVINCFKKAGFNINNINIFESDVIINNLPNPPQWLQIKNALRIT